MPYRRYTKKERAEAVAEAARTSVKATSESKGIPERTLGYWYDHEDFATIRAKTREELAGGSIAMALLAQAELVRRIQTGSISDQALVVAYGVGIDKAQLLMGAATSRNESVSVTDGMDDHERSTLKAAVRDALAKAGHDPE